MGANRPIVGLAEPPAQSSPSTTSFACARHERRLFFRSSRKRVAAHGGRRRLRANQPSTRYTDTWIRCRGARRSDDARTLSAYRSTHASRGPPQARVMLGNVVGRERSARRAFRRRSFARCGASANCVGYRRLNSNNMEVCLTLSWSRVSIASTCSRARFVYCCSRFAPFRP